MPRTTAHHSGCPRSAGHGSYELFLADGCRGAAEVKARKSVPGGCTRNAEQFGRFGLVALTEAEGLLISVPFSPGHQRRKHVFSLAALGAIQQLGNLSSQRLADGRGAGLF